MERRGGKGQYDEEYRECPCFWGIDPAKFVRLLPTYATCRRDSRALDLGAGEGKNAFFLQSLGYRVMAVEVSRFACRNFLDRMIREEIEDHICLICGDVRDVLRTASEQYDLVVAYGLLHCLPSEAEADELIAGMKRLTRVGGINIVSAFTDRLPIPKVQEYLSPTLFAEDFILRRYENWTILRHENDVLTETHPTSGVEHQHSLFRLLARRER